MMPNENDIKSDTLIAAEERFKRAEKLAQKIKACIGETIIGQEAVINLALCAIFGGGHALLIGMPGLAKTKLVEAIAIACGLKFNRIQFTPDLMPSDILGSEILDSDDNGKRSFRFVEGPIFTQLLMADEINRASPRTQSALLQAMQEQRIAIFGKNRALEAPFHVLATQNPIEHEGAYPLPEAQLDRFMLQINVPYPDEDTERQILLRTTGTQQPQKSIGINAGDLIMMQELVRNIPISDEFLQSALSLVRQLRPETTNLQIIKDPLEWGPGPRGGQALIMASKAHALLRGFFTPSLFDLSIVAKSALGHRMALNWRSGAEYDCGALIDIALASLGK